MTNKTKRTILNLIYYAAILIAALAIIASYRMYGFRAALIAFSAACAMTAMCLAAYSQDDLEDEDPPEEYETRKLKGRNPGGISSRPEGRPPTAKSEILTRRRCNNCGETFECHVATELSDEKKQEFQLLRRCPICGGELEEDPREVDSDAH